MRELVEGKNTIGRTAAVLKKPHKATFTFTFLDASLVAFGRKVLLSVEGSTYSVKMKAIGYFETSGTANPKTYKSHILEERNPLLGAQYQLHVLLNFRRNILQRHCDKNCECDVCVLSLSLSYSSF